MPTEPRAVARERFVTRGSARLYVREIGRGHPVVVLHGGPDFGHEYLLPELDRLADRHHLVYYDQRGRGRSFNGDDPAEVTMRGEVEDLDGVRQALGLRKVALLGHSWGALLAMEYALAFPHSVSHLILMNPAPASSEDASLMRRRWQEAWSPDQAATLATLVSGPAYRRGNLDADAARYRIHFASALARPELVDVLVGRLRDGFTEEGLLTARAIERRLYDETYDSVDFELFGALEGLAIPTLVLHGTLDAIPVDVARHIAGAIPGAELRLIPDCGHFAYFEEPEQTGEVIAEFLER